MGSVGDATFALLLARAGMTKAELARRLGIHPNTVSSWGADAPEYARAYLRLYVAIREALGGD